MLQAPAIGPSYVARAEVAELAAAVIAQHEEVSRRLTDTIHGHLDELDDDLHALTLGSVHANLGMLLAMLRDGADPATAVAPPEALAYAREYVRRGLPFELLAHAYRTAQAALSRLWLQWLRSRTSDPDGLVGGMAYFNDWLFAWVEAIERQLTEAYMREREQWLRSAAAMRAQEVRALLEGEPADPEELSLRLGYDLARSHIGFVVFAGTPGPDQERFNAMEQLAGAVADAYGGGAVLTVPHGADLACWTAPRRERPVPMRPGPGLHVALGGAHRGIDGFARTHLEALAAQRVARRCGAHWAVFADVALDALAMHDLDAARRFVEAELGPLAGGDDAARRMAATLRVFLEQGCSYVRAGRQLGVHENTVAYRVRRAEELLGHGVTERQLELRVALRLARVVG